MKTFPRLVAMFLPLCLACGDGGENGDGETGTGTADDGGTGTADDGGTGTADDGSTGTADDGSTGTGTEEGCGPPSTFEDGKTPTSEIHVANGGTDAGGCGAEGSPCASIDFAAGMAEPGAAVVVHEGTYAGGGYISDVAGTVDAPIWVGGAEGEQAPVIEGGGEGLHLSRVRYLVLHDLEVRNTTANGVNADDGGEYDDPDATRFVIFRGLFVHDIGTGGNEDCLKLSGLDDYFVLDSRFERCGGGASGSAIDHVGCHAGLLVGNLIVGDTNDPGGSGVQCKGGSFDIEIRGNRFVDAGHRGVNMGGSTGFEFFRPPVSTTEPNFEASDIRVVANVFERGVTPFAYVGCVGCLVANNTIVDPESWLFRILQETTSTPESEFLPASDGELVNNIFYFDRSQISTYVNIGPNTDAPSFSFVTNLWYAHDDPGSSDPSGDLPAQESGGIVGQDPELQSPDHDILASSPAAGAGTPIPEVHTDLVGRCYASPPSIGAYEVP